MKIKFFLDQYIAPDAAKYQHNAVALAEGFRELGIEFYGNIDYWFEVERNSYLIQKCPDNFKPDITIYHGSLFLTRPETIRHIDFSAFNVLIDHQDGYAGLCHQPEFIKFKMILRLHYSSSLDRLGRLVHSTRYPSEYQVLRYGKNVFPWAFGLTERICGAVEKFDEARLKNQVLVNFRVKHNLRLKAYEEMIPLLEQKYSIYNHITNFKQEFPSYYTQSGGRHNEDYYKDLNESLLTFAVAGWLMLKPFASEKNYLAKRMYDSIEWRLNYLSKMIPDSWMMIQCWDSWRMWESLVSNTCPVHMDYDHWGFVLPVMPEKYVHYWPIEGLGFADSAKKLAGTPKEKLMEIGKKGKKWALENYSPLPTAKRFLKIVEGIQ